MSCETTNGAHESNLRFLQLLLFYLSWNSIIDFNSKEYLIGSMSELDLDLVDQRHNGGYSDWDTTVDVNYFGDNYGSAASNQQKTSEKLPHTHKRRADVKSPHSILRPFFRIVECGGDEWSDTSIQDTGSVSSDSSISESRYRSKTHTLHNDNEVTRGQDARIKVEDTRPQETTTRKSFFNPVFRIVECGGSDVNSTLPHNTSFDSDSSNGSVLSSKMESLYHTMSSEDVSDKNDCSVLPPSLHSLWGRHRARKRVAKQAMFSFFSRESAGIPSKQLVHKRVSFQNPLVNSVTQIPRIQEADMHHFFFSDQELAHLYKERGGSSQAVDDHEIFAIDSSTHNNYEDLCEGIRVHDVGDTKFLRKDIINVKDNT